MAISLDSDIRVEQVRTTSVLHSKAAPGILAASSAVWLLSAQHAAKEMRHAH
jgi:protein involved in temperature-dependent protein secretion